VSRLPPSALPTYVHLPFLYTHANETTGTKGGRAGGRKAGGEDIRGSSSSSSDGKKYSGRKEKEKGIMVS